MRALLKCHAGTLVPQVAAPALWPKVGVRFCMGQSSYLLCFLTKFKYSARPVQLKLI